MQTYIQQVWPVLDWLLGQPASDFERWLALTLAILAGGVALWLTGQAFRFNKNNFWLGLAVVIINWLLTVALMAVARAHLTTQPALLWGVLALIVLVLAVLVICGLMQVSYWTALLPWCVSIGAMAGVILLVQATFQSMATGDHQADGIRQHNRHLRELTED